jgi:G3E family GTPase
MSARRGRKPPIPLTVVTGATGAGKTTLINRLLQDGCFANTAVILNEFGAVELANTLVERAEDGIISLGSGCVCCTVRGELVDALERLLRGLDNGRIERVDRVIIETAGVADPAAIVAAVLRHPYLSLRFAPDGIVAIVDAEGLERSLDSDAAAVRQAAMADVILLTRAAPTADQSRRLERLNPTAVIAGADKIAPEAVKGHGGFEPGESDPGSWIEAIAADTGDAVAVGTEEGRIHAFAIERARAIPAAALDRFIDYLAALQGANLIRVRGIAAVGDGAAMVVDGIGGVFHPPALIDGWPDDRSRFVVTASGLDRTAFEGALDAFLNEARIDNPDREALTANPLAIAGFSARSGR